LALGLVVAFFAQSSAPSRDLLALWLAGTEVASGHPQAIYPPIEPLFTMRPALDWYAKAEGLGRPGPVYPYIYPPIWAFLLAPLTKLISFSSFATVLLALNAAALVLMPQLAARLTLGHSPSPRLAALWSIGALAALLPVHGMLIAYMQGQIQILVAFLTLLALERTQNGRPVAGGAALGLAIALKLAPLPVALIWLIAGERRAGLVALATAAALGAFSVLLAGWPLHESFLAQLQMISHTLFLSSSVASLDQMLGIVKGPGDIALILNLPASIGPSSPAWGIAAKPALYALLQTLLIPVLALGFGLALRRITHPARRAALWGAALTAFAFLGPIGWLYYYIAPIALVPLFVQRGGWRGLALPALALALLSLELSVDLPAGLGPLVPMLGSLGILLLLAAYLRAALTSAVENPSLAPQSRLRRAAT